MPATRTTARRSRASAGTKKPTAAQKSAAQRYQQNGRVIERVTKSLESAQADLSALRGSIGTGATDLRKDVARLLRDARRDLAKMSKTVRRDLELAQRDLASAARSAGASTGRSRRATRKTTASKSRSRGAKS